MRTSQSSRALAFLVLAAMELSATAAEVPFRHIVIDGNLDIFAAEMYSPGCGDRCRAYVLYGDGKGNFRTEVLCTGIGSHESKLGDLNGNGKLDILQRDFEHEQRVDVWLNQGQNASGGSSH